MKKPATSMLDAAERVNTWAAPAQSRGSSRCGQSLATQVAVLAPRKVVLKLVDQRVGASGFVTGVDATAFTRGAAVT